MRKKYLFILLSVLLLFCACREAPRHNVIVISIDTLRADHLGCYGYQAGSTPNIDAFAARSIRYAHCFTPVPITLPAHTSMLTGMYPPRHSVRDNGTFVVPPDVPTLATLLKQRGYKTMAVIGSYPLHSRFGLNRDFDVYDEEFNENYKKVINLFYEERKADQVVKRSLQYLDETDGPFFLFMHFFDPHHPWNPPEQYMRRYLKLPYDGEIANTDAWLGHFFRELTARGYMDNTIIVFTADHGEGLEEKYEFTHSILVYNGTMHVPLMLYYPGVQPGVVNDNVSLVDIVPTMCGLLDVDLDYTVDGLSLLEPLPVERKVYGESLAGRLEHGWNDLRCLMQGDFKYIMSPGGELYNLAEDFKETTDLAQNHAKRASAMDHDLRKLIFSLIGDHTLDDRYHIPDQEVQSKLEALGYLSGGATTVDHSQEIGPITPEGDARKVIHVIEVQSKARQMINDGEFYKAINILLAAKEQLPNDQDVLRNLVLAYLKAGQYEEAVAYAEQIISGAPGNPHVYFMMAFALNQLGRTDEALDHLEQAMAIEESLQFHTLKARLLLRKDRQTGMSYLQDLLEQYPCEMDIFKVMIQYYLMHGDREAMQSLCQTMLRCDKDSQVALYNLGNMALEAGDWEQAENYFQHVLTCHADYLPAYYGMALVLQHKGDYPQAKEQLEHVLRNISVHTALGKRVIRLLNRIKEQTRDNS